MLKSSYEIASVLARAFEQYTNRVQNGDIQPYLALLNQDKVDVVFTVTAEGGLSVASPKLEKPVLDLLSEAEVPMVEPEKLIISKNTLIDSGEGISISGSNLEIVGNTVEEKPKRSRKKKVEETPVEETPE